MSQPLVSVILTYYNHARYVAQAVESVLNQTYSNLELFVINDGSPDTPDFEQAVQPFLADPRLNIITQFNRGVAASRNEGLARSKGQYWCLLDSDDWLHPEKLARQVAILEDNPDLGMVYCDVQRVSETGEFLDTLPMPLRTNAPLEPNVFEALWIIGFFEPSTPLLRREWYEKSGPFTVGIEGHSDYEFWLRLSALGCPVRYLPERLVYYRSHRENFSKKTAVMDATRLKARRMIIEKFPDLVAVQDDRVRSKLDALQFQILSLQVNLANLEQQQTLTTEKFHSQQQQVHSLKEEATHKLGALQEVNRQLKAVEDENRKLKLVAQDNLQLHELLVRYSRDLKALQQTRTVRFSAWIGKLANKFRIDKDV